ncbi:hypothetical protein NW813_12495 [Synechococcus sp. R55.6]|uniref:hypothetical protein n=1 Tax=unclassified Synechococcus TaxID=2626047 RepID=UPI0039C199DE
MKTASFCLLLVTALLMALAPFAQARPRQRTATATTPTGGSLAPRGGRTFTHSGTYTGTGPSGRSGSGTYSGQGSRQFIPGQGVEGDYSGQVTTQQGQTWNLNHQHTTTRTNEGWQRQGSTTVHNAQGETVGSSSSLTEGQAGQGWQRSGQFSNARDQTCTTESRGTPTGPGQWQREAHVFNAEGDLLGGTQSSVQYRFVPGQGWVKTVEGKTLKGQPIRRTTTIGPNP